MIQRDDAPPKTREYPRIPRELALIDLAEQVDELRRFMGDRYDALERKITAEYLLVRTQLHAHGERIGQFLLEHENCQSEHDRARREAASKLAALQQQLNSHVEMTRFEPARPHRDSDAIEASLHIGKKLTTVKIFAASFCIGIVLAAAAWLAMYLK